MDAAGIQPLLLQSRQRQLITMYNIPVYNQFRFKFTAAFILFVSLLMAAFSYFSLQAAESQFHHLLQREFKGSQVVASNFLNFVEQTALITAKSGAADSHLIEILTGSDMVAVTDRLRQMVAVNSADILTLIDRQGVIIACSHPEYKLGTSLRSFDFVHNTITGTEAAAAIVQDLGNLLQYGTAEVVAPTIGSPVYLLAGFALNNNFVDHIQENSHIDVSLVRERSIIATTLSIDKERITSLPVPFLEYELLLADPTVIAKDFFLGKEYYISAIRLPGMQQNMAGSMFLARTTAELILIKKRLINQFLLIFIVILSVSMALIFFFTNAMIRPVHQLIQTSKQLAAGELSNRCIIGSKDELGLLASHFNQMADAVQERDRKLREHRDNLEQLVEERTAKVLEQSLLIENVLRSSTVLGIAVVDMDSQIQYFNHIAEKIFGYKAEEILGRSLLEIHVGEHVDIDRYEAAMLQIQTEGYYSFSHEQKKNGKPQYIESTINAIIDNNNIVKGYVLISQDVTRRQEMEQEVLKSKKFEAFSILAGGLAHDFNNLLQVIIGGVSFVLELMPTSDSNFSTMQQVEQASQQAAQLANEMLILSQGGYEVMQPTALLPVLREQLGKMEESCDDSREIIWEAELGQDLWQIKGNLKQLEYAINNIMQNSLDAMPDGGTLTLSARNREAEKDKTIRPLGDQKCIEIRIIDTGIGISQQDIDRIFDPYFSTRERGSQKGMGLSLALTASIIKKHDGQLSVDSQEKKGTTVTIYLPAMTHNEEDEESKENKLNTENS